jgi:uncharacterized protein YbjT (DUF2867 family)
MKNLTKQTITVMGATGNIGKKLTQALVNEGHNVRAIVRSAERASELKGAELFIGDAKDAQFLAKAFTGSDAVFAMIPPDYTATNFRAFQNVIGEAIAKAITASGVKNIVNLSSIGAELDAGTGPILGLHDQEVRLNKLQGLNLVHLRPAYFFENVFFGMELIKGQNIYGTPISPSVKFAQVATKDIADKAKALLVQPFAKGVTVQYVLGPSEVSMQEIAKVLEKTAGKPGLAYVQFPPEAAHQAMVGAGLSPDVANMFLQLYEATNRSALRPVSARNAQNTTKTSFADFAALAF